MPTPRRYVALLCFHEDTEDRVTSNVVLARAESILQGSNLEYIVQLQLCEGRDVPLVHSLITEDQPFDKPTMCTLSLVVVPDGTAMPRQAQLLNQSYVISDELTLVQAFHDLLERHMGGYTILASAYRVTEASDA